MPVKPSTVDLPLRLKTPDVWASQALEEPLELLNDHAHLEKKAATNALELLNRWPDPTPPAKWVQTMTSIARDEVEHLAVVTRILARRGGRLTKGHRSPYANSLRRLVRNGQGTRELLDRLLVSALIEARSCERFEMLSRFCDDRELAKLYAGLWASENGHYRVFLERARDLHTADDVEKRWDWMLNQEAKIVKQQTPGPRMHSGWA
ncbi:MAG: tRNA-(ms[2]io[6]A)-hydroxylase [Phycisphaerales bacterium]|nr:tRNA-(ms[2]io[6]A)-hydroxylase [Phycisphaerales bacterium]